MIQGDGERNFHVFYYLFAGMPKKERERLALTEATEFNYLRGGYRGLTRDVVIDIGMLHDVLEEPWIRWACRYIAIEGPVRRPHQLHAKRRLFGRGTPTFLCQCITQVTCILKEIQEIQELLACLLHIGNIEYGHDDKEAAVLKDDRGDLIPRGTANDSIDFNCSSNHMQCVNFLALISGSCPFHWWLQQC